MDQNDLHVDLGRWLAQALPTCKDAHGRQDLLTRLSRARGRLCPEGSTSPPQRLRFAGRGEVKTAWLLEQISGAD